MNQKFNLEYLKSDFVFEINTNMLKVIKIFIFAWLIIVTQGCNNVSKNENPGKPRIEFVNKEFDFGNITMGELVSHRFIFKNTGTGNLVVDNVIVSCGCTIVTYDKKPIAEGGESFVEVSFNSDGYRGLQKKEVEVYSNCDSSKTVLTLWAYVDSDDL